MEIKLSDIAKTLNLSVASSPKDILEKIKGMNTDMATLATEKKNAEDALALLKTQVKDQGIVELVDKAIADKKFKPAQKESLLTLGKANFESLKSLVESTTPYESIKNQLEGDGSATSALELDGLMKLTGQELFKQDKLEKLKKLSMPHFRLKYQEAFGKAYTE